VPEPPGRLSLPYGHDRVEWTFDPDRFTVLRPAEAATSELDEGGLAAGLDRPVGSPRLEEIVRAGESVCIVMPDATRASGSSRVAALLASRLAGIGVPARRIRILIGAGTHRTPTAEEVDGIVGAGLAREIDVRFHDAFDAATHTSIGTTSRGTPVELNRDLVDADRVILFGAIGFHYFAGFSGGRKAVLPACASVRSIQRNHLLAFDHETLTKAAGVESAIMDGNPVSEDMEEAAAVFGADFLVNTVLDGRDRICALYAGHWRLAHRKGCADYLASHLASATERRPVVVTSCGGAPRDINMIQSHKALEHAKGILEDGGDLVLLAECPEGLGRPDFLDWFVPGGSRATARMLVADYKLNGQTAWGIRWKSERYNVRLVSSLDPAIVEKMGMIPYSTLGAALADCGGGRGYVIPNGLGTLPVLESSAGMAAAAGE